MKQILPLLFLLTIGISQSDERPNIFLVMVDDFGRELIGALGGESYETPNLDRLATDGLNFDICYATPMCSPTRNLVLSGKYNFRNYTTWGKYDFEGSPTIANTLRTAGYTTAAAGKWHLGGWNERRFGPSRAGFDQYATFNYPEQLDEDIEAVGNFFWNTHLWVKDADDEKARRKRLGETFSSAYFRDFVLRFVEDQAEAEAPFFVYYPMILAHRPFVPTDLSEDSGVDHRGRIGAVENFPEIVRYVDDVIGELRETLANSGQAENTLIVFTADNGTDNAQEAKSLRSQWKGRMLKGGKYVPTELGANVPLLAVWPAVIEGNRVYEGPTDLSDLHLTFARLAGAELPADLDGHDLTPVLRGTGDSTREYAYTWGVHQYSSRKYKDPRNYRGELLHILRDERWKYQSDNTLWDLENGWPQAEPMPQGTETAVRDRFRAALHELRQSEPKLW